MMKVIFPPHKGQGKSEYDAKPKQLDFALTILRDKKGDATQIEIVLWMEIVFVTILSQCLQGSHILSVKKTQNVEVNVMNILHAL